MSPNATLAQPLQVREEAGKRFVAVPAGRVEALQTFLQQQGVGSTVCIEPYEETACLEIWPGPSADDVRRVLADWNG